MPRSDCACAQSDQGLRCPLKELSDTVEYNCIYESEGSLAYRNLHFFFFFFFFFFFSYTPKTYFLKAWLKYTIGRVNVYHHSAGYILFCLESLSPSWLFWKNRIPLKPALEEVGMGWGVAGVRMQPRKLQCCIWRGSIGPSLRFCVFFVSKGSIFLLLLLFYKMYSIVAGVVPCGGRKMSPRTSS